MNETWKTICEDYESARAALWNSKQCSNWRRDEDKGYYHLWKSYYTALNAEEKEPLLFARILMMMGSTQNYKQSDCIRLHRYYLPAKELYEIAIESGLQPTEKELKQMKLHIDILTYQFACEEKPYKEQLAYIEGYENLSDFSFYDSKVVFFSHDENSADLKLKYSSVLELHFEDVDEIVIRTDPVCDWVNDFYCYPAFHNRNKLIFDIGFYRILCSKIVVTSYER